MEEVAEDIFDLDINFSLSEEESLREETDALHPIVIDRLDPDYVSNEEVNSSSSSDDNITDVVDAMNFVGDQYNQINDMFVFTKVIHELRQRKDNYITERNNGGRDRFFEVSLGLPIELGKCNLNLTYSDPNEENTPSTHLSIEIEVDNTGSAKTCLISCPQTAVLVSAFVTLANHFENDDSDDDTMPIFHSFRPQTTTKVLPEIQMLQFSPQSSNEKKSQQLDSASDNNDFEDSDSCLSQSIDTSDYFPLPNTDVSKAEFQDCDVASHVVNTSTPDALSEETIFEYGSNPSCTPKLPKTESEKLDDELMTETAEADEYDDPFPNAQRVDWDTYVPPEYDDPDEDENKEWCSIARSTKWTEMGHPDNGDETKSIDDEDIEDNDDSRQQTNESCHEEQTSESSHEEQLNESCNTDDFREFHEPDDDNFEDRDAPQFNRCLAARLDTLLIPLELSIIKK